MRDIGFAGHLASAAESKHPLVERVVEDLANTYAAPRDWQLVTAWLASGHLDGRVLVGPAGSHTRRILPLLDARAEVKTRAVVDQRGGKEAEFFGRPAMDWHAAARAAARGEIDHLFIAHTDREPEIMRALRRAGAPEAAIRPLYLDSHYQSLAAGQAAAWEGIVKPDEIDAAVIATGRSDTRLIRDEMIAHAWPGARIAELYMGRTEDAAANAHFPRVVFNQSLDGLHRFLSASRVGLIYLRCNCQFSMPELGLWLGAKFPQIKLVIESYDQACFLTDERLANTWGFDAKTMDNVRLAEMCAFRHGALVIHKNVGPVWEAFSKNSLPGTACFFPGAGEGTDIHKGKRKPLPRSDGRLRAVYPAGLRPIGLQDQGNENESAALLSVMGQVVDSAPLAVDIYNHSHVDEDQDDDFAGYVDRLAGRPIFYHRRVDFDYLLATLPGYDFGWLYNVEQQALKTDYLWQLALPSKFSLFVECGLPTNVVDLFESAANLVRAFEAGIVLPADRPDLLGCALAQVDLPKMRRNVSRLRGAMRRTNHATLSRLGAMAPAYTVFQNAPPSPP